MHFGLPVVPDEYRMYSGWSKGSEAKDAAPPLTPNSCQRLARPGAGPSAARVGRGSAYGNTTTRTATGRLASAPDLGWRATSCLSPQALALVTAVQRAVRIQI